MKALTYPDEYGAWSAEYWIKSPFVTVPFTAWAANRLMRNTASHIDRMMIQSDKNIRPGDFVNIRLPQRFLVQPWEQMRRRRVRR